MSEISVTGDKVLINGYKHIDLPIGTIIMNAGNSGTSSFGNAFLLCNGSSVSRTQYNELYLVIGTKYGTTDAGFFNLPNFIDTFPMGLESVGASQLTATDPYATPTTRQGGNLTIQTNQFRHGHASVTPVITGVNYLSLEGNIDNESPFVRTAITLNSSSDQVIIVPSTEHLPPYYTLNYFIYTGKGAIG